MSFRINLAACDILTSGSNWVKGAGGVGVAGFVEAGKLRSNFQSLTISAVYFLLLCFTLKVTHYSLFFSPNLVFLARFFRVASK